jgi:hypothetical protein
MLAMGNRGAGYDVFLLPHPGIVQYALGMVVALGPLVIAFAFLARRPNSN